MFVPLYAYTVHITTYVASYVLYVATYVHTVHVIAVALLAEMYSCMHACVAYVCTLYLVTYVSALQ